MSKILIVDDDINVQKNIVRLLRRSGFELYVAASAEEAMRKASETAFDVALVDIKMPGTDGVELLCRLKSNYPTMEIVLMTGHATVKSAIAAVKQDAYDYLLKPISNDELLESVSGAVEKNKLEKKRWGKTRAASKNLSEYQDLVMNYLGGIIVVSREGKILFINLTAESLLGRKREQILGEEFGVPLVSGELTEIDIVRPDGVQGVAQLDVKEAEWGEEPAYIAMLYDVTARKDIETLMQQLAYKDELTGLTNRRVVVDRLSNTLLYADRHKKSMAVLFVDLDGFKPINDEYGHMVGDQVLLNVARRLQDCVRASDTVGRIGGDEFVILLLDISSQGDACGCAHKINIALRQPIQVKDHALRVRASVGIALYPIHGEDAETLLANADKAMYSAKKGGKNTYRLYTPSDND